MSVRADRRRIRDWWADLAAGVPDSWQVLEAVTSMKCLDEDGEMRLLHVRTNALTAWEAIGMLVSAQDDMRAVLSSCDEDCDG